MEQPGKFSHTAVHCLFTKTTTRAPRLTVLLEVVELLAASTRRMEVEKTVDKFNKLWQAADGEPFEDTAAVVASADKGTEAEGVGMAVTTPTADPSEIAPDGTEQHGTRADADRESPGSRDATGGSQPEPGPRSPELSGENRQHAVLSEKKRLSHRNLAQAISRAAVSGILDALADMLTGTRAVRRMSKPSLALSSSQWTTSTPRSKSSRTC